MIEGRKTRVAADRCTAHGIKEVVFGNVDPTEEPMFYSPPTNTSFGEGPRWVTKYRWIREQVNQFGFSWVYLLLYIRQHAGLFRRRTNVNDGFDGDPTFAHTSFAQRLLPRDICPERHLLRRHLPRRHLPRKTFAQMDICP
jgi:hypothetical protein